MFYIHHKRKFGNKKTLLTKKINEYKDKIPLIDGELQAEISKLDLTTFEVSSRKLTKNVVGGMTLKLLGVEKVGLDTLYRLLPDEPSPTIPETDTELLSSQADTELLPSQADPWLGLGLDDSVKHVSKKRKRGDLVEEITQVQQAPALTHRAPASTHAAPAPIHNDFKYQQQQHYLYNYQHPYTNHQAHNYRNFNGAMEPFTANNRPGQTTYAASRESHQTQTGVLFCQLAEQFSRANKSEKAPNQYQIPASRESRRTQKDDSDAMFCEPAEQISRANQSQKGSNQSQKLDEGHYESLCTRLTEKLEKASTKLERRKEEYNVLVQKCKVLEEENHSMKSRLASLERSLGNSNK